MPIIIERKFEAQCDYLYLAKDHTKRQISLKLTNGIGILYE